MAKKKAMKKEVSCKTNAFCWCNFIMAIVTIVLIWVWPAELWSQIVITVLAAILGLKQGCCCRK